MTPVRCYAYNQHLKVFFNDVITALATQKARHIAIAYQCCFPGLPLSYNTRLQRNVAAAPDLRDEIVRLSCCYSVSSEPLDHERSFASNACNQNQTHRVILNNRITLTNIDKLTTKRLFHPHHPRFVQAGPPDDQVNRELWD